MINKDDVVLDWNPPSPKRLVASVPYRLHAAEPVSASEPLRSKTWKRKSWLNQGREGACTGFGAAHVLSSGLYPWLVTEDVARSVYYGAQRHDQWVGESYVGSSVHGAMDFMKKEGIISGYLWAETLEELIRAVNRGPVEMGTNVYTGWFSPDSEGNIKNTGIVEGGHAYALGGVNLKTYRGEIWQSWGTSHGKNGTVYMDLDEIGSLLHARGEAALVRRRKYDPTKMTPEALAV